MKKLSLREGWENWWLRETPPHLMAIFRIAFAGFLLFYFAIQLPDIAMRYSEKALLLPLVEAPSFFAPLFAGPPVWAAYSVFGVFLLALLSMIIGFWTRVSTTISFLLYVYYWIISLHEFGTSFDRLFLFTVFVLISSGCGETFSLDAHRKYGSWLAWRPISILPQRILSVQIAFTYLGVGWQKIVLPAWQGGEVLSYGFIGRWATPPAYWFIRLNVPMWFWDSLNFLIKCFEFAMPIGLWFKPTRWWFFLGGFLFHTFITVFLAIWWFQVLIPAYIVFFEPEEVSVFLRRYISIPVSSCHFALCAELRGTR